MTNYGDQFMKCPECGGTAEAECVDVGVGLYISNEYECPCGYNSAADGRMNVSTYDDWFPDLYSSISACQQKFAVPRCSECGEPQFMTPHGICCSNGHGGAHSL